MTTPRQSSPGRGAAAASKRAPQRAKDVQPQATGANRGSPAAPVMKQFAKTAREAGGKS